MSTGDLAMSMHGLFVDLFSSVLLNSDMRIITAATPWTFAVPGKVETYIITSTS
eukprot:CAMPEP_0169267404 /NCGR_PEP_ID=MMETSP1016-20121227/47079_1 /TAXON_ID=342587 /ORGANISM="Karlodinium micrum, Strain CCMP2283" /LENGTH=53 /DNA_ID=CAMNT_0009351707 /DNA_START=882 /DNA_END=1043 /DNA_ORIENTATION=+